MLALTRELCSRASVTPDDAGCQDLIAARLERAGFRIERMDSGAVRNLWASHGSGNPVTVLLGHTDVVPTGDVARWSSPPFEPMVRGGRLYARGAADMKGAVAAMTIALERFVADRADHAGTLALLLTSDEEGEAIDGVRRVAERFAERGQRIDHCIVGEPSSHERLGDVVRVGRRGSLHAHISVEGVQGHVAYPDLALNPIHAFAPALTELAAARWDEGDASFPPTSFQISNIRAGTGATNVIPAVLEIDANFRFGTASSADSLRARVESILDRHGLSYRVDWIQSGAPFLTAEGRLRNAVVAACVEVCGIEPRADTGGGTSDGRFIAPMGAEVVELGPCNASIHKIDEHVAIADLERLPDLYVAVLRHLASNKN